tara:strand:+ start:663 stop:2744 length:2082 start_codon:yes stop_codon:yes gene_type:complete
MVLQGCGYFGDRQRKRLVIAGVKCSVVGLLFVAFACLLPAAGEARVGSETVEVTGHGTTINQAINRALVSAITQVNGAAIASRARSALDVRSSTMDGQKVSQGKKSFQEEIAKKTKGIVKRYEILSQGRRQGSELYRVTLSVTVATFRKSPQLKRLRMAVVPFRMDNSLNGSKIAVRFEETFRRGLENYLTQTRRFAMLDRSFIKEQNDEFSFLLGKDGTHKARSKALDISPRKQRYAFVVGMGAYQKNTAFKSTINSALLVAKKLRTLGFKVQLETDLNFGEFIEALKKFKKTLLTAPSDSTSLFFFSGHGASINSSNALYTIDEVAVPLPLIFDSFLTNYKGVKIVLIDACRSGNRLQNTRAFDPPRPRDNTFISFSTAPGTVAYAGEFGSEGLTVYSASLTKFLGKPGQSIETLFKSVRSHAQKLSNGKQIPWENSSLVGDFYFNGENGDTTEPKKHSTLSGRNFAGGTATEELARIGNRVGTDYLVTGIVEKAYSNSKKFKMKTTGQVVTTPQIGARVTYRILDVASTQVKFAATAKIHRESGKISNVADGIAASVGQKILNAIFPVYVLSVEGDQLTLGQGGDTIKKGAVYSLVKLGKEIIDPYTQERLGQSETIVGSVRITDTQSKLSTAKVLKLDIGLDTLLSDEFIVRPRKGTSAVAKKAKRMRDLEKEFDKEFEDDEEDKKEKW